MSDTDRLYRLLKREGSRGVHTLDLRREGFSGNPSQRATDIEAKYGVQIDRKRERRGDRNGSRYVLVGHRVGGRGEPGPEHRVTATAGIDSSAANATPSSVSGQLFDLPPRSAFTDPEDVAA